MMAKQSTNSGRIFREGDVYSFRTSPATEFSPRDTNRYAALKVLNVVGRQVVYVVLDGVFDRHPVLAEASGFSWLRKLRFSLSGEPAYSSSFSDWECGLEDFQYVGNVALSPEDQSLKLSCQAFGRPCGSFGAWTGASHDVEGEWRWRNDRDAYIAEVERDRQARDAKFAAQRERYEARLKGLTWEKLLEEMPLSRWDEHPPFPPPNFTAAARIQIRSTILALQALGTKPRKAAVRTVLKNCVEWFNTRDDEFGGVIETEEREDICAVLEELAVVARHRSLTEEFDGWRTW